MSERPRGKASATRRPVGYYVGAVARLRVARGDRCEAARLWPGESCDARGEGLQFAHLQETPVFGRGRGRSARYHDIKKHPSAYALLCARHHKRQESEEMAARRIARGPVMQVPEREPGEEG